MALYKFRIIIITINDTATLEAHWLYREWEKIQMSENYHSKVICRQSISISTGV